MKINMTIKTLLVALIITSATQTQAMNFNWKKWTLIGAGIAGITLATRYVVNSMRAAAAEEEHKQQEEAARQAEVKRRQADAKTCRPLLEAVERNDFEAVRQFIDAGVDLNLQCWDGWTALISAAARGYTEIVQELIDTRRVNFNLLGGPDKLTALMYVAQYGRTNNIAQALINAGAKFDLQNNNGFTALMLAVQSDHIEIVQALLEAGANRNLQSWHGWTALMIAAARGYTEIVQVLINAGADCTLQNRNGETALMIARRENRPEIVDLILKSTVLQVFKKHVTTLLCSFDSWEIKESSETDFKEKDPRAKLTQKMIYELALKNTERECGMRNIKRFLPKKAQIVLQCWKGDAADAGAGAGADDAGGGEIAP